MKKIIITFVLLFLFVIGYAFWSLLSFKKTISQTIIPQQKNQFPSSVDRPVPQHSATSSAPLATTTSQAPASFSFSEVQKKSIQERIQNTPQGDIEDDGVYRFAQEKTFTCYYLEKESYVLVVLTGSDTIQAHEQAVQFLMKTLSIPYDQLCAYPIVVSVSAQPPLVHFEKDIGFKACPRSKVLYW